MTSAPPKSNKDRKPPVEHEILFQNWFKSVGPRTYAAQLKRANNGNHFLVLTEGNRHKETGDIRKTRLFLYSEDFVAFFRMLHEAAVFIRENPVPEEVKRRQEKRWAKENAPKSPPGADRPARGDRRNERTPGRSANPTGGPARREPPARDREDQHRPGNRPSPQLRPAPIRRPSSAMQPA